MACIIKCYYYTSQIMRNNTCFVKALECEKKKKLDWPKHNCDSHNSFRILQCWSYFKFRKKGSYFYLFFVLRLLDGGPHSLALLSSSLLRLAANTAMIPDLHVWKIDPRKSCSCFFLSPFENHHPTKQLPDSSINTSLCAWSERDTKSGFSSSTIQLHKALEKW